MRTLTVSEKITKLEKRIQFLLAPFGFKISIPHRWDFRINKGLMHIQFEGTIQYAFDKERMGLSVTSGLLHLRQINEEAYELELQARDYASIILRTAFLQMTEMKTTED